MSESNTAAGAAGRLVLRAAEAFGLGRDSGLAPPAGRPPGQASTDGAGSGTSMRSDSAVVPDDHCRICAVALYCDDVTDPASPLWLDADGEYATCGDGNPHIPCRW